MKVLKLFYDKNHNFVEPDKARWCVIEEYDDSNNLLKETWITLKRDSVNSKNSEV